MVAGVFIVPALGDVTVILRATLGGAGVSTLGGVGSPKLCGGYFCTTLGGEPGLLGRG